MNSNKNNHKIISIKECVKENDVERLKLFAKTKGGLVDDAIRCKVWPLFLGLDADSCTTQPSDVVVVHHYTEQIERDVERSLWKFVSDEDRPARRIELSTIINAVLSTCPSLHYFQGYHDIASVLLIVCGERLGYALLKRLSFYHIRDNMNPNMDCNIHVMSQIEVLLEYVDVELYHFIKNANLPPYYGLSWILTWFSHNIDDLNIVARLFDYFLVSNPYTPLYLTVAIIVQRKEGILSNSKDSTLYKYLGGLLHDNSPLPWEELIQTTEKYLEIFPPETFLELPPPKSNMKPFPFNTRNMFDSDTQTMLWRPNNNSIILIGIVGVALTAYFIGV